MSKKWGIEKLTKIIEEATRGLELLRSG